MLKLETLYPTDSYKACAAGLGGEDLERHAGEPELPSKLLDKAKRCASVTLALPLGVDL